jgi:hypothetical protein
MTEILEESPVSRWRYFNNLTVPTAPGGAFLIAVLAPLLGLKKWIFRYKRKQVEKDSKTRRDPDRCGDLVE